MGISLRLPDPVGRSKAHGLKYRTKNKERLAKSRNELLMKRKKLVYDFLGGVCSRCGFSDNRALQIDHINGFGRKNMNRRQRNAMYYYLTVHKSLLNNENKYQILCANCNWIKRYENKECSWDYTLGRNDFHKTDMAIEV